jgi:hypothetical protein
MNAIVSQRRLAEVARARLGERSTWRAQYLASAVLGERSTWRAQYLASAVLGERSFALTHNAPNICALGRSRSWDRAVMREELVILIGEFFSTPEEPQPVNFFQ